MTWCEMGEIKRKERKKARKKAIPCARLLKFVMIFVVRIHGGVSVENPQSNDNRPLWKPKTGSITSTHHQTHHPL